jgi:hypothetical protein
LPLIIHQHLISFWYKAYGALPSVIGSSERPFVVVNGPLHPHDGPVINPHVADGGGGPCSSCPVGQHATEAIEEYVPAGQDEHVDTDVAPIAAEYVPAGQDEHVDIEVAPIAAEYVPAGQDEHVDTDVAPIAVEYLPALHPVHSDDPITPANVPAGHGVLTPLTQYVPTSHCMAALANAFVPYDALKPLSDEVSSDVNVIIMKSPG